MYCDTVHERVDVPVRGVARCMNCKRPLYHGNTDLGAMLAVTITATLAFVVANTFPLITLTSGGFQTEATLWHAITASYDQDLPAVAVVKLAGLAETVPGWGLFGVAVMTLALASLASFDHGMMWRRADELRMVAR